MDPVTQLLLLGLAAGAAVPVGGWLAKCENIHPQWLENELRHFIVAFGGGALISAVALVLVPEGIIDMPIWAIVLSMAGGGLLFMGLDVLLARSNTPGSQLAAMLADFLPEAIALGAFIANGKSGILLAFIIALQNVPEGFNAYRELIEKMTTRRILTVFALLMLLGPLCTSVGYFFLADYEVALRCLLLFASGGILYLVFQDIAPQSKLQRHWLPPMGAVLGFLLGLIGHVLTAG